MNDPYVLIEGPKWADAKVYGNWLLAAAKAEALWKQARKDPVFAKKIERLMVSCIPEFRIGATVMLAHLTGDLVTFSLQLNSDEGDEFVMMAEMGFFALTGERYQLVIPKKLSVDVVKSAALKYARTEDAEYELHPEDLAVSLPKAKALRWQKRLLHVDEDRRCADRISLLNATSQTSPRWHQQMRGSVCSTPRARCRTGDYTRRASAGRSDLCYGPKHRRAPLPGAYALACSGHIHFDQVCVSDRPSFSIKLGCRDLVLCTYLAPRLTKCSLTSTRPRSNMKLNPQDWEKITDLTLSYHNERAEDFWEGTRDHNVMLCPGGSVEPISGPALIRRGHCPPSIT